MSKLFLVSSASRCPRIPGLAHRRDCESVVTDQHEKRSVIREPGVRVRVLPSDRSRALAVGKPWLPHPDRQGSDLFLIFLLKF